MKVVNLTGNDVRILYKEGITITFPRGPAVATTVATAISLTPLVFNGAEIEQVARIVEPHNIPLPQDDTIYLVSKDVALAATHLHRRDLFVPEGSVRDKATREVLGYRRLATY